MQKLGDKTMLTRLYNELLNKDWFMTFPDYRAYVAAKEKAYADYENREEWAKKMLVNISKQVSFPLTARFRNTMMKSGTCQKVLSKEGIFK